MAASNTPEISAAELEIKRRGRRRLIGAITIGLLAIVFLPMIFDSEPKRLGQPMKTQDISVQVPSKEGQQPLPAPSAAPVVVATVPVTAAPATTPAASDLPKVTAPEPAKPAAPAEVPPAKVAPKETSKPVAVADKPSKADSPSSAAKTGFVVQLGVFSDADNAKQVLAKMKEAKLAVYTESIPIKSGTATRIRVGPYATREKADAALAQVKLTGADGKIVPLK